MRLNKNQSGFSLLILLIMLMGFGGFALANYSQNIYKQVEKSRFEHNQEVLQQAKEALLMYAYNYPQTHPGKGPGRLPCPDHDNDGLVDVPLDCDTVGRLPWRHDKLDLFDTEDSSGENLWYAVSSSFDNFFGGGIINSDTLGTITIFDQTGNLIYDGSGAGIAAIIIAPGAPINGQDRSIANGDDPDDGNPDTDPGIIDPANYLDAFAGFDNSAFVNGSGAIADGFRLGPVYVPAQKSYVINDQMIIITADEVTAMAEKAVLKSYQDEIANYQQEVWGGNEDNYRYPWLNSYSEMNDPLTVYNPEATSGNNIGRIPITPAFGDYDSVTLETDLDVDYQVDVSVNVTSPGYLAGVFSIDNYNATFVTSDSYLAFSKMSFDSSVDNKTDNIGRLEISNGTINSGNVISSPAKYFWDGCSSCAEPADGWEVCNVSASSPEDCARTSGAFVPYTDWTAHDTIRIRLVQARWTIDNQFNLGLDHAFLPTLSILSPPDATKHARIQAVLLPLADTLLTDWKHLKDNASQDFIDGVEFYYEQDNLVGSVFNVPSLGNANSESESGTLLGVSYDTATVNNDALTLTYDYHIPAPQWITENNWDSSVMMAYSSAYSPAVIVSPPPACVLNDEDGFTDTDECLQLNNFISNTNNIKALLVIGGEGDLVDEAGDNYANDLGDIFDGDNASVTGLVFDKRAGVAPGNSKDKVLILESL